ncbi:MAG: AzlC family ABC transporter permease, partial [Actinomycetota bacterium]
ASAWLLGVRNGFYALRLAPVIQVPGLIRPLAAQLTIDESNAVSLSQAPDATKEKLGFWLTGISVFVFWNGFTALGALIGSQIGNPNDWGLDAAAAAAFLGLIWPRLRDRELLVLAVSACLVAVVLSIILPSGLPVLMAAAVAVVFWGIRNKK